MIRRCLIALWLLITSVAAIAQALPPNCPDLTYTWTVPYSKGSIQATSYSVTDLWFQVLFFNQQNHVYVGVPLAVANQFTFLPNGADSTYNTRIKGRFPQALLNEITACPLLNEVTAKFLEGEQ